MFANLFHRLRRITTNQLYFPEIDGIRFLAIILVIVFHAHGYFLEKATMTFSDNPASYPLLESFMLNGGRGVQLFFVLSGFILCLPFAHYYINNGKKVELKRYYLRRLTRLEPPYFIAMILLFFGALAIKMYSFSFLLSSLLASLVYMHNIIFQHRSYINTVAWSLEIEIQFYLIAPLLFRALILPKIPRRILILAASLLFIALQQQYPSTIYSIYNYIQYFLFGILLADLYVSGDGLIFLNHRWVSVLGIALLPAIFYIPYKTSYSSAFIFPFLVTGLYLIILRNEWMKSVFSYKFIPIIGGMCYSIYLLHYPIISVIGRFTMKFHLTNYYLPNLCLQIILMLIPILVLSSLYYYLVERPFMSSRWIDILMKKDKKAVEINPVSIPEPISRQEP